jgi:hypothetical protein
MTADAQLSQCFEERQLGVAYLLKFYEIAKSQGMNCRKSYKQTLFALTVADPGKSSSRGGMLIANYTNIKDKRL